MRIETKILFSFWGRTESPKRQRGTARDHPRWRFGLPVRGGAGISGAKPLASLVIFCRETWEALHYVASSRRL